MNAATPEASYRAQTLIDEDIEAYLVQHQHKSLLRFITCGSVDDGKSTLIGRLLYDSKMIFEDQLAALEADSKAGRHARREHRFRAPGGWARRGARAGHHHRCGIPLFLHRETQVHRRRHPGTRAIHPQHGNRRLHGGPCGAADRCAQGGAHANTAPRLSCAPSGNQEPRARRQQDGPGRIRREDLPQDRRFLRRIRDQHRHRRRGGDPDIGPRRRQHHDALQEHGLVYRSVVDRAPRIGAARGQRRPGQAVLHAGAVGQPSESRFSRLRGLGCHGQRQARRCRAHPAVRARQPRSPASSVRAAISTARSRASR